MEVSQAITQNSASNLAQTFFLLPKEKRDAMAVLYAFCREVDDVADDDSRSIDERRKNLELWREDLNRAYQNKSPKLAVNRDIKSVLSVFPLRQEFFEELLTGMEMDLEISRYETWDQLEEYCYRAASVVGLLSIEIFGYKEPASREYAIFLGKALQLTNILRDVQIDAARGRIYLPIEELHRHGVSEEDILNSKYSDPYARLAKTVAERARSFYSRAAQTLSAADRKSMIAAELMGAVYWRLLEKLEQEKFNVFRSNRVRVSRPEKLLLILKTWSRLLAGSGKANYGN
jgi:phytoene synthase